MPQAASAWRTAERACRAEVGSAGSSVRMVARSALGRSAPGASLGGGSLMALIRPGRRGLEGLPSRGESWVAIAAAAQAEPAEGLGDLPAPGPGAAIGCGINAVAEPLTSGPDAYGHALSAGRDVTGHAGAAQGRRHGSASSSG